MKVRRLGVRALTAALALELTLGLAACGGVDTHASEGLDGPPDGEGAAPEDGEDVGSEDGAEDAAPAENYVYGSVCQLLDASPYEEMAGSIAEPGAYDFDSQNMSTCTYTGMSLMHLYATVVSGDTVAAAETAFAGFRPEDDAVEVFDWTEIEYSTPEVWDDSVEFELAATEEGTGARFALLRDNFAIKLYVVDRDAAGSPHAELAELLLETAADLAAKLEA